MIPKELAKDVISKELDYVEEQDFVDRIFSKFDTDRSGYLERGEMRNLMRAVVEGDVIVLEADDPESRTAACVSFRITALERLRDQGKLDDHTFEKKRALVVLRHPQTFSPKLMTRPPDEADLEFVMTKCDSDGDGRISRAECVAAVGTWIALARESTEAAAASRRCAFASAACALM